MNGYVPHVAHVQALAEVLALTVVAIGAVLLQVGTLARAVLATRRCRGCGTTAALPSRRSCRRCQR